MIDSNDDRLLHKQLELIMEDITFCEKLFTHEIDQMNCFNLHPVVFEITHMTWEGRWVQMDDSDCHFTRSHGP